MRAIARVSENSIRAYADAMNNNAPAVVHPFQKHFDSLQVPDGGFSINPVTHQTPSQRFMVAEPGFEQEFNAQDLHADHIKSHADSTKHLYNDPNTFQGGWRNPENDKIYLDVSKQYNDINAAQLAARKNQQLAIFDNHDGKSIPTAYQPGDKTHA